MAKATRNTQPGRLRIVAGIWRSRLLQIADVPGLRPTGERIRETLFNWLANDVPGARCLDLCAGTGALGLEALSRGAQSVVFVEKSRIAARTLRANIDLLQTEAAQIVVDDARHYLEAGTAQRFDIIFLDPPFAEAMLSELCRLVAQGGFAAPSARIYLEMDRSGAEPDLPQGWQIRKDKASGSVRYMLVSAT